MEKERINTDQSELDKKYFISGDIYNCPYCNRRNVKYEVDWSHQFDWDVNKKCYIYIIECMSCNNKSMHLSYEELDVSYGMYRRDSLKDNVDLDEKIFYSVPTSFFIIDSRINRILRELITEAEGCLRMNYLTGASACARKAIYELLIIEKAEGDSYQDRIKYLKNKYKVIDSSYFDTLAAIQVMTSDKLHEQSWDKWNSSNLKIILETLKAILYDMYVIPQIRKERSQEIQGMREDMILNKKNKP